VPLFFWKRKAAEKKTCRNQTHGDGFPPHKAKFLARNALSQAVSECKCAKNQTHTIACHPASHDFGSTHVPPMQMPGPAIVRNPTPF